jgi:hypothetical protein
MADQAPKRTFAQGKKGGWYVVGSDRQVNGKLVRDYVSAEVALRAMAGKATEQEIAAATSSKPETKVTGRPQQGVEAKPQAIVAGVKRTDKARDPRLPKPGTEMRGVGKNKRFTVKEGADGVFTLYDDGKEVSKGHSLTAAWIQHNKKPGSAYTIFGLNRKDEVGSKDAETGLVLTGKRNTGDRPEWLPDAGKKIESPKLSGYVKERDDGVFVYYNDKDEPEMAAYSLNELKNRMITNPNAPQITAQAFWGLGDDAKEYYTKNKDNLRRRADEKARAELMKRPRDERLPEIGTKMESTDGTFYVIEEKDHVFKLYDSKTDELLTEGASLTSAISRHKGKGVGNAFSMVGLKYERTPEEKAKWEATQKEYRKAQYRKRREAQGYKPGERKPRAKKEKAERPPKEPRIKTIKPERTKREKRPKSEPRTKRDKRTTPSRTLPLNPMDERKKMLDPRNYPKTKSSAEFYMSMHFRKKLKNKFRAQSAVNIGTDKKGWQKLRIDLPDGKQVMVKTKPGQKVAWAKENKPDAKPFKVTERSLFDALKTEKVKGAERPSKAVKEIQKAIAIGLSQYETQSYEIYTDGVAILGVTGGLVGFVPIDLQGEPLDCVLKALGDSLPDNTRINFQTVSRANSGDCTGYWKLDEQDNCFKSLCTPEIADVTDKSVPQAFCFSYNHKCFVGANTADELYDFMGVISKSIESESTPKLRKGYPKKIKDYADQESYKYPIDTEAHVKAALSYFGNPDNRKDYDMTQKRKIARRIVAAAKNFGIDVSWGSDVGKLAGITK